MFYVTGGKKDFNLDYFTQGLVDQGLSHGVQRIEELSIPTISYNLNSDQLQINNKDIVFKHLYQRRDVFKSVQNIEISNSWYRLFRSYGLAHPEISMFNKRYIGMNKVYNLREANKVGLTIPKTLLTNGLHSLQHIPKKNNYIIKHIAGGSYTLTLEDYLQQNTESITKNQEPISFLQQRLVAPEMRVYIVGENIIGYYIHSSQLDYRIDSKRKIEEIRVEDNISSKLITLARELKLDFGAADFKMDPKTGEPLFLEINSDPMIGAFDKVSNGGLVDLMIRWHQNFDSNN